MHYYRCKLLNLRTSLNLALTELLQKSVYVLYCWPAVGQFIFLKTNISQGSVTTRFKCIGIFNAYCKFTAECSSEDIL